MTGPFVLHPQLAADSDTIIDLALSRVLLIDERRYPWLVLVPRVAELRELCDLPPADRQQLLDESCSVAGLLKRHFAFDKLNVATLGNLVPQLHLHHVARRRDDPAWPGPVWGHSPRQPYPPATRASLVQRLRADLAGRQGQ